MSFSSTLLAAFALTLSGCHSAAEAPLTNQETLDYLAGRPLVLPEQAAATDRPALVKPGDTVVNTGTTGQAVTLTARTVIIDKANISNLTIGKAERVPTTAQREPTTGAVFLTPVTFIYRDGSNTDAVEATLESGTTGGKRVFFGYHVKKVARQ
jgi:hypothetical protein